VKKNYDASSAYAPRRCEGSRGRLQTFCDEGHRTDAARSSRGVKGITAGAKELERFPRAGVALRLPAGLHRDSVEEFLQKYP